MITIFKKELESKADLISTLTGMCEDIAIVAGAYALNTRPGYLFAVLRLLNENKVAYRTSFAAAHSS